MKCSSALITASVAFGLLLFADAGRAEERQPSVPQADRWQLEEKITELEQQISSVLEAVRGLRRELELQPKTTVVFLRDPNKTPAARGKPAARRANVVVELGAVKYIKASVAANSVSEDPLKKPLRGGRNTVIFGANDRLNAVMIYANESRTKQLQDVLSAMDVPGK